MPSKTGKSSKQSTPAPATPRADAPQWQSADAGPAATLGSGATSSAPLKATSAFERPVEVQRVIDAIAELNAALKAIRASAENRGRMPEHLIFLSDVGAPGRPNLIYDHYRMGNATVSFEIKVEPKQSAPIPSPTAA